MSLVDSLDSVIMAYSYTGFLERSKRFRLLERRERKGPHVDTTSFEQAPEAKEPQEDQPPNVATIVPAEDNISDSSQPDAETRSRMLELKRYTTSNLGIVLTLMSILVAFR
jgi:high-affinity nickel-transport protein